MSGIIKKLLIGASLSLGVSAIATAPAFAFSISGTSDYYVYDANATNTFRLLNATPADIDRVMQGDSSNVTGNIELFASSESLSFTNFLASNNRTTLNHTFENGTTIAVSSLTALDWFGTQDATKITYNQLQGTLARTWYDQVIDKYESVNSTSVPAFLRGSFFTTFRNAGIFQRFSDPNFSYINQANSGKITFGLAGHYDAGDVNPMLKGLQLSELFKVTVNDGPAEIKYAIGKVGDGTATNTGLREKSEQDKGSPVKSHSGNYEFSVDGPPVTEVPEPSTMLGLMAVSGLLAAKRKMMKNNG